MKKVLLVIGKLCVGGAERIGRDIGYFADKNKYEIHYLVYGEEKGDYEDELMEQGCKVHHMAAPSDGYRRYYSNLTKLLKKERYDVVHSHTMFSSYWVLHSARKCGVPIRIAHSHTIRGPEKRSILKNLYENSMRILVRAESTCYVACGKSAGEWLFGKKTFAEKGQIIYNGIQLSDYAYSKENRDKIRNQYGIGDKLVLGHVGHLAPVKNQAFILKLLFEMLQYDNNLIAFLIGDGPDRNKLRDQIRQFGIEDNVILTGNVTNVGEYMSAMDVFLFPSLYEGMPLALVEAQTNGLPCIISDRVPEDVYLTNLISKRSIEEPEANWIESIHSSEREEPEKYERIIREKGFDIRDMLNSIYALYEE